MGFYLIKGTRKKIADKVSRDVLLFFKKIREGLYEYWNNWCNGRGIGIIIRDD